MKHFTLEQKYNLIKQTAGTDSIGIHNYGLLHEIADALELDDNSGVYLHIISRKINRIMRQLIQAGYPVKEYKIKCCSWAPRETWHPYFTIE